MPIRLFKSFISGIGTGAGVAWPMFGLIFNALNNPVGSTSALILGSITSSIFLLVAFPVAYFSYQLADKSDQQAQKRLLENKEKLINDINIFYPERCYSLHLGLYLKADIIQDMQRDIEVIKEYPLLTKFLFFLIECKKSNQTIAQQKMLELFIKNKVPENNPSKNRVAAFFNLVSTFGSLVGCYAGMTGMLTGVGLLGGFLAFPFLGVAVISAALICSVCSAHQAYLESVNTIECEHSSTIFKQLHHQFLSVATKLHGNNCSTKNKIKLASYNKEKTVMPISDCRTSNRNSTLFFKSPQKHMNEVEHHQTTKRMRCSNSC